MRQSLYEYCIGNGRTELLSQWDEAANLPLTPRDVSYGSKQKLTWRCEKGHTWQAQVWSRTGNHSGCPVCAGRSIVPGENDLAALYPELAAEWHPTRNGDVSPMSVAAYSHHKAWWRCPECGHEWLAEIKSRANGSGCPVCTGKTVVPGVNDLKSRYPELLREWHPTKNGTLSAGELSPGMTKKVWWRCGVCGHDYQASVANRTHGSGCPVCAGKTVVPGVNDLASKFPEIAAEWDREKNGRLSPSAVTEQSNRKVWWRCKLRHSYQTMVSSRTSDRQGCPYCAGQRVLQGFNDLASVLPGIAAEWHPTLNEGLAPADVTCGSAKKVWWKCKTCGYEWKAVIFSRAGSQRSGCPLCAGKARANNRLRYQRLAMDTSPPRGSRRYGSGRDSPPKNAAQLTGTDPP